MEPTTTNILTMYPQPFQSELKAHLQSDTNIQILNAICIEKLTNKQNITKKLSKAFLFHSMS